MATNLTTNKTPEPLTESTTQEPSMESTNQEPSMESTNQEPSMDLDTLDMIHNLEVQMEQYEEAIALLKSQRSALISAAIENDNLENERWVLDRPIKITRSVDIDGLRRDYPEIFEEVATLTGTNAERALGKEVLRSLVIQTKPEAFHKLATVTIGSLESRFGKDGIPEEVLVKKETIGDWVLKTKRR